MMDKNRTHSEQIHDGVTRLSKKGLSEANAEQRTWINFKTERFG